MEQQRELQSAYEDARRDLEDAQARLRIAAKAVSRLQGEVSCLSAMVQEFGHRLQLRKGEVAA